MIDSGQLEPMPDEYEPIPGLKLQTVRGHSETMQTWRLDRGGQTMYGFADLIPNTPPRSAPVDNGLRPLPDRNAGVQERDIAESG
jgi:hypothetical protein